MIRRAQFAGSWYPGEPDALAADLDGFMVSRSPAVKAHGVIAPHAGYMYSGAVAGSVYARVQVPDTVVVLAVNHRGMGARAAIMPDGSWETPLGAIQIRTEFALELMRHTRLLEEDVSAHRQEHSLELHLPFLQRRNSGFRLVPVCLQQLTYSACAELGNALAATVQGFSSDVLLVASTDMTHFETQSAAKRKDSLAIQRILDLDPRGLYDTVQEQRISMCGYIPTTAVLCACKALGARQSELVQYSTSGDTSGDYRSVVGYAGILLH